MWPVLAVAILSYLILLSLLAPLFLFTLSLFILFSPLLMSLLSPENSLSSKAECMFPFFQTLESKSPLPTSLTSMLLLTSLVILLILAPP